MSNIEGVRMKDKMSRAWAMPSPDTFICPPIGEFVNRYKCGSKISVDPFSRNGTWATYTNDIDPNTKAESHKDAREFLDDLWKDKIQVDLVILDPPYSPRQIKEVYQSFGKTISTSDTQTASLYKKVRSLVDKILTVNGIVLSFGWNSTGMGRSYERLETLLVCHGGAHNDTICLAEKKLVHQMEMFL